MGYPIELTDNERRSALAAVSPLLGAVALGRTQPVYALGPVVDAVVEAVNKSRAGDPVGTIRRLNGHTGLRVDDSETPWRAFTPHGLPMGRWTQKQVSAWPVIYSPED